jgi:hypothetical protein
VRGVQPVEGGDLWAVRCCGCVSYDWSLLHVPVPAFALETHGLFSVLQPSPLPAVAVDVLLVNCPELSRFCRSYRRVTFYPREVPCRVNRETSPHRGHDYPQIGHQHVKHVFTICICVLHGYNMSVSRPIHLYNAILRYKRFVELYSRWKLELLE